MTWEDFYKNVDIEKEVKGVATIHKPLIESILSFKPKNALEIGAGSGALALYLTRQGLDVSVIDNSKAILEQAAKRCAGVKTYEGDAFKIPFKDNSFDVVYSQGFMEHFHDIHLEKLVAEQLRVSKQAVLFSVPNNYYNHKDFGDEYLRPKEEWDFMLSKFGAKGKNYFPLRAKRNFMVKHSIMYMCVIKKED